MFSFVWYGCMINAGIVHTLTDLGYSLMVSHHSGPYNCRGGEIHHRQLTRRDELPSWDETYGSYSTQLICECAETQSCPHDNVLSQLSLWQTDEMTGC